MDAPLSTDAESALVDRLRAGEDAAFEELVRSHAARILCVARRILANEDDAHDAVQEAFLSAFKSIDRFQGDAKLSTWLHRIVVNAALMRRRSMSRKPEEELEPLLPHFTAGGHFAERVQPWTEASDALLERAETRALVRRCIDELPDSYRTALILRDIEELDTEDVARHLGVSVNAAKIRVHRARQALRTVLDRHVRAGSA